MFGHKINVNFNKKNVHKTLIGGFASLVIKIALMTYVVLKFKIMFNREKD